MTPDDHALIKQIFFEVCDLPADERRGRLLVLCKDRDQIRAGVEALLREDSGEDEGLFASRPESAIIDAVLADEDGAYEPVGEIAGCRMIRKIAEGGMGAVYECEQASPRRRVAIKLVRQGLSGAAIQRRFRHEAEILGHLKHPNIARVYEAGVTQVTYRNGTSSRSAFMMMEMVTGQPLHLHARTHRLGLHSKLELMIRICDGIRHAHAMGIIHRDLKPANILVEQAGMDESSPGPEESLEWVPRILDFGVARMTGTNAPATTRHTQSGQLLGTLAYMSPEQLRGDPTRVDTRSDVYSLGVILYELLTDRLPLVLDSTSLAEAARIIRDVDPPDPGSLAPELRGELTTIVNRALAKAPEDRYQSAADLGGDLQRYLNHEPIIAKPATRLYVLRKFAQRNRGLVISGVAAAGALVVGTAIATTGLFSAMNANARLQGAVDETARQLGRSELVTAFMRRMLLSVNPAIAKGRDTSILREVLEETAKRLDSSELAGQPEARAEILETIAETYSRLGENTLARETIEKAIELVRAAPDDSRPVYLRVRKTYAALMLDWANAGKALTEIELAIAARARAGLPVDAQTAAELAVHATALRAVGRIREAGEELKRVVDVRLAVQGESDPDYASALANLAGHYQNEGRLDEALELLLRATRTYEALPSPMHVAYVKNNTAAVYLEKKEYQKAQKVVREGLEIGARIFKPEHQQMGMMNYTMAFTCRGLGQTEQAIEHFTASAEIFERAFGGGSEQAAAARVELAHELVALGRRAEADTVLSAQHAKIIASIGPTSAWAQGIARELEQLHREWARLEPGTGHEDLAARWAKAAGG